MDFVEAIKSVYSKYAVFSGRARRSEFWYFYLFYIIANFILALISPVLQGLWVVGTIIPTVALSFRRMHDIGKPGWLPLACGAAIGVVYGVSISEMGAGYLYVWRLVSAGYNIAGKYLFWLYLPLIVGIPISIYMTMLFCKDSQPGTNQYGPNPKEVQTESNTVVPKIQTAPNTVDKINPVVAGKNQSTDVPAVEVCQHCGARRENNSKFCEYCGSKFE